MYEASMIDKERDQKLHFMDFNFYVQFCGTFAFCFQMLWGKDCSSKSRVKVNVQQKIGDL